MQPFNTYPKINFISFAFALLVLIALLIPQGSFHYSYKLSLDISRFRCNIWIIFEVNGQC